MIRFISWLAAGVVITQNALIDFCPPNQSEFIYQANVLADESIAV